MGRDNIDPTEPHYYKGAIQWSDREGDPNIIFEVDSSSFIDCFPVDNKKVFNRDHVAEVARYYWAELEDVARVAKERDAFEKKIRHREMNVQTWRIDSRTFKQITRESFRFQ
jgi:hypothetical protein